MSRADSLTADAASSTQKTPWPTWLPLWSIGWALAAAFLVAGMGADALRQHFPEPDNAMRLVNVRDVLAGQAWFDAVQHRLNPPDGVEMHWARWIDFAIAAPIAWLTPLTGRQTAEIIVSFAWPLGLLAVFMALVVRVCGELGAKDGLRTQASVAGAIVAALAIPAVEKFGPGSLDHHGVELILSFAAALGLMAMAQSPRAGALAGAALGAAMATAAEGLPIAVAGVLIAGLLWLFAPQRYARGLAWLGAGLAATSLAFFIMLVPPSRWGETVCDTMSISFLGFGLAAGAVAVVLASGSPAGVMRSLRGRFGAAAALGGIAGAMLWLLFPQCAGGGYAAMSADMKTYWLAQISEVRTLADLAGDDPAMILAVAGSAFAGLCAAILYLRRRWREAEGWIMAALLLTGWCMLIWQIRGASFAAAFAIPFGAWAVARARQAWKSGARAGLAVFVLAAATSSAAVWTTAGEEMQARLTQRTVLANYEHRTGSSDACMQPAAFAPLRAITPGLMLNSFVIGPAVLQHTTHSVTAAPYHRNVDGVMTMIAAMRATPDVARAMIAQTPADYVLICAALPEMTFYARHPQAGIAGADTLAAQLSAGFAPDWLVPVPLSDTPLKLYRIVR